MTTPSALHVDSERILQCSAVCSSPILQRLCSSLLRVISTPETEIAYHDWVWIDGCITEINHTLLNPWLFAVEDPLKNLLQRAVESWFNEGATTKFLSEAIKILKHFETSPQMTDSLPHVMRSTLYYKLWEAVGLWTFSRLSCATTIGVYCAAAAFFLAAPYSSPMWVATLLVLFAALVSGALLVVMTVQFHHNSVYSQLNSCLQYPLDVLNQTLSDSTTDNGSVAPSPANPPVPPLPPEREPRAHSLAASTFTGSQHIVVSHQAESFKETVRRLSLAQNSVASVRKMSLSSGPHLHGAHHVAVVLLSKGALDDGAMEQIWKLNFPVLVVRTADRFVLCMKSLASTQYRAAALTVAIVRVADDSLFTAEEWMTIRTIHERRLIYYHIPSTSEETTEQFMSTSLPEWVPRSTVLHTVDELTIAKLVEQRQGHNSVRVSSTVNSIRRSVFSCPAPPYTIIRRLGGGSFGSVYEVRLNDSGQKLALKQLYTNPQECDSKLADILNEVNIMRSIDPHPNIVQYRYAQRESNTISIFMELCDGGSLGSFITTRCEHVDKINVEHMCNVLRSILDGISFLHNQNIVHCDLKPENVMFHGQTVKITDFGSAVSTSATQHVLKGKHIKGTYPYMAPEALLGEPTEKPCDIWSFGCIVADLFDVQLPQYALKTPVEFVTFFSAMEPDDCITINTGQQQFPPSLIGVIESCLQRDPLQRPSAEDLKDFPLFAKPKELSSFVESLKEKLEGRRWSYYSLMSQNVAPATKCQSQENVES